MSSLAQACLALLEGQGETLATAESLTAGLIASELAEVPGASAVLRGGLVAYATEVKSSVLGIDADLIAREGVVSRACAEVMATRALVLFGSDWAVSATGVAGPTQQDTQPVGLVYVAVAGPGILRSEELHLKAFRQEIRADTVSAALSLLHTLVRAASDVRR